MYPDPKDFVRRADLMERQWSLDDSLRYTSWLAQNHYENFHVASVLLPKRLHRDFYNVYAFCRWADDLGDEIGDERESLRLLHWWREELHSMQRGEARHPVYVALMGTAAKYALPTQLFDDLIAAFVQDQTVHRYRDWDDLFGYCRYSANPVGRLVLRLCGYADPDLDKLSDATCTALQLANFWQDIPIDLKKGRIYLPIGVMERHGYSPEDLGALRFSPQFQSAMREAVDVARKLFLEGLPLVGRLDRRLAFDLELFSRGGMRVLEKIERQGYDVLSRRPSISKMERVALLAASFFRIGLARAA